MKRILILALMAIVSPTAWADCSPKSGQEWQKFVQNSDYEKVVFFASWCGGCTEDLLAANDKTILVASFDEQKNAEKALRGLLKDKPVTCVFDVNGEIAKLYEVKGLPASRDLKK